MRSLEGTPKASAALLDEALTDLLFLRAPALRERISKRVPARFRATVSADDVLQEVWLRAYQSAARPAAHDDEAIDRWLSALMGSALTDALRAARAGKRGGSARRLVAARGTASFSSLFQRLRSPGQTPSREARAAEVQQALREAVQHLEGEGRQAVELHHLEGLSRKEVAQRLELSESALHGLLFRARRELRRLLGSASRFLSHGGSTSPGEQRRTG